jgi:hypothetical protein
VSHGSDELNPLDGSYLHGFRVREGVDISCVKTGQQPPIDDNPFNRAVPENEQLYVGWRRPGEWFNLTVKVLKAGRYGIDFL